MSPRATIVVTEQCVMVYMRIYCMYVELTRIHVVCVGADCVQAFTDLMV